MILNILKYWKWIVGGFVGFMMLLSAFGFWCYDKGKTAVYQEISQTPVKTVTVIKHDTIPAVIIIKWLKPEKIYETPPEVLAQIDSLGNNVEQLKATLVEKAKPFETKIDSARFSLSILTNPWSRTNDINLTLKAIPYQYPEITHSQMLVKDLPWWKEPCSIAGVGLLTYGILQDNKTCGIIGGGLLVVRIAL